MFLKYLIASALLVAVNCRSIEVFEVLPDGKNIRTLEDLEEMRGQLRQRRQVHGSLSSNPDGSSNLNVKVPLVSSASNQLSAVGGLAGARAGGVGSPSAGLAWDNVNGHGASVTGRQLPGLGTQLTAAGRATLYQDDAHRLAANAFATRTMPSNPAVPNFNTYGTGAEYMYKDKIGASLGASHTDLFKRTDYSAMGNLNLFKGRDSSLDLSAGYSKSVSPFLRNQSWQPSGGLSFTKYF